MIMTNLEMVQYSIRKAKEQDLPSEECATLMLLHIARSLAVIADSVEYNKSYDKAAYDAIKDLL